MNKTVTILISSAGRRVELMGCFQRAAAAIGCSARIIAVDVQPQLSAACHAADLSFRVPPCTDPSFVPALLEICQREQVSLLVPTIDPELAPFAEAREKFQAIETSITISSPEIIALARDKLASANFFRDLGLNSLRTALLKDVLEEPGPWKFPLVIKPITGSSSQGFRVVPTIDALRALDVDPRFYLVQDQQQGKEYTVNLFFNRSGLVCAIPHQRIQTRGGEVTKAVTSRLSCLTAAADKIGSALAGKAFGPLCFQAIVSESGAAQLIELNARFGGGYPLADRAGATFARWLLELVLKIPSLGSSFSNNWQEGLTMLRYDSSVFIPPASQA